MDIWISWVTQDVCLLESFLAFKLEISEWQLSDADRMRWKNHFVDAVFTISRINIQLLGIFPLRWCGNPVGSIPLQSPSYDWSRFVSETRKRHHYPRREITSLPELLLVSLMLWAKWKETDHQPSEEWCTGITVYLTSSVQFSHSECILKITWGEFLSLGTFKIWFSCPNLFMIT